ncbi:hypothetical protein JKF63_04208 [Porcisia hertigi]|uniref:Uncharacterized protein n=1 Tax=Porcisia hertigi TaxID=2761500 RepID=A0A836LHF2_9TRYP|nr:hypothetical protein JKF63_04208 [Porcisia hertigi]
MSEYLEIIEADKAYLEKVGMRDVLEEFLADALKSNPANIYEYMMTWATKRQASSTALPNDVVQSCGEK